MTKTIQERIDEIIDAEGYMGIEEYNLFLQKTLQEVHTQAVEKQNAMFARHIDEIMKITSSPQELVDWLAYYRNTLTNKQNI